MGRDVLYSDIIPMVLWRDTVPLLIMNDLTALAGVTVHGRTSGEAIASTSVWPAVDSISQGAPHIHTYTHPTPPAWLLVVSDYSPALVRGGKSRNSRTLAFLTSTSWRLALTSSSYPSLTPSLGSCHILAPRHACLPPIMPTSTYICGRISSHTALASTLILNVTSPASGRVKAHGEQH